MVDQFSDEEVVEAFMYLIARYLVIRQEHIDLAEDGVDYNVIKYNELGKAEFVNPNMDVAYLEAWLAVDEDTPAVLTVPQVEGRYYTAQVCDEWADIITNINERNYPDHPFGEFAFCLAGTDPDLPNGAVRVNLPSRKAKILARVERQGDDETAVALQHVSPCAPSATRQSTQKLRSRYSPMRHRSRLTPSPGQWSMRFWRAPWTACLLLRGSKRGFERSRTT